MALLLALSARAGEDRLSLNGARLAPAAGMTVNQNAKAVSFAKVSDERRFLGFEAPLKGLAIARALEVRYALRIGGGSARLAFLAFDSSGNAWFGIDSRPLPEMKDGEARLTLRNLAQAGFSRDERKPFDWKHIVRIRFGVVLDGPARGTIMLRDAALTDEPYRPTRPLVVPISDPKLWSLSHDPAATLTIARVDEGKPCTRIDCILPGGRHMYAVPSVQLQEAELSGYSGLRLTYRAVLPKGIDGLLVMLIERNGGTQYYADPAPKASGDWTTVTIPFERFQRGSWSKDDNDRLDLDAVLSVAIGVHGTTTEAQGKGAIWLSDVAFVP
jgi:hypothetical protein